MSEYQGVWEAGASRGNLLDELAAEAAAHVWRVSIDTYEGAVSRYVTASPLSSDETRRAESLVVPSSRSLFVQTRTALRVILSMYLHREPADIQFAAAHHGKPRLATPADTWLHFNVSHSGAFAVLAFAGGRPVGVDVERVRDDFDPTPIAERYFAAPEAAELARLAASQRSSAFFAFWSRKEAVLKALGTGLSTPLSSFSLDVSSAAPLPVTLADGNGDIRQWALCDLPVGPGYVAALAMPHPMLRVRQLDYGRATSKLESLPGTITPT